MHIKNKFFTKKLILPTIAVALFFIPFLWLKPGEMDLGGDTSRLYFYDPISYLQNQLYNIVTSGVGGASISYFAIPIILFIALVKTFIVSPTMLIAFFHGLNLTIAFLAIYLIISDFITLSFKKTNHKTIVSVLSGLLYVLSPSFIVGWDKVILTHNQFFLNPLMFLLLFRFLMRDNIRYLIGALIISFIFSPNFSFVAAPGFFAFYPLALLFILLYVKVIKRKSISFKKIILGIVLFLLLHSFHLLPHIMSVFSIGTGANSAVFSDQAKYSRGLSYFMGIAPSVKASIHLMNLPQLTPLSVISFGFIIFPVIILLGMMLNRSKEVLLTVSFFLIALFFVTANITSIGFEFYKKLFDIPGFSMFRNYYGQWSYVFQFFYTLLFGLTLYLLFSRLKFKFILAITSFISIILILNAYPFFTGELIKKIHHQSKNISMIFEMDPEYEKILLYIKNLQVDGKFISFPLAGPGYQTLGGKNGGAYQGPSTISYLAGKNDFTGYDGLIPFNDTFLALVQNNDYRSINRLFSILNIKYIFYNSDSYIYDDNFPQYPYEDVRDYMPRDQKAYQEFLQKLPIRKVKDFGSKYHIYEVDNFLPHIYTADSIIYASDPLVPYFVLNLNTSLRSVVFPIEDISVKNSSVIVEAKNRNAFSALFNNFHLHRHEPFVSKRMDNIFYPLLVWKERDSLQKKKKSLDDYLDYSLLYLSKRVFELEKYNETPISYEKFVEPQLWELNKWKSYYSWEASLTRYEENMKSLITWISGLDISDEEKNTIRIKINENISQHELHLLKIIKFSKYTNKEKKYLLAKKDKMFGGLYRLLSLKPFDTSLVTYDLKIPEAAMGEYDIYLKGKEDSLLNPSLYSLTIAGKNIKPISDGSGINLIEFDKVTILNPHTKVILHHKPKNMIEETQWLGTGSVQEGQEETMLSIDSQLGEGSGFSRKISRYKPNTQYVITFDYYTESNDFIFKLHEKQKQNNEISYASYFNKNLNSNTWKKHQSIVTSSLTASDGYLQFTGPNNKNTTKLHLRNISVVEVPDDQLIFKKIGVDSKRNGTPKIFFTRINPTKYSIKVTGASEPYALVFSEAFNEKWKLFLQEKSTKQNDKIIASYFNGDIKEREHDNAFFDPQIFKQSSGKIVSQKGHMVGNGYANAWIINPEDVNGKQNYELILAFDPQKDFYIYLGISLLTVASLVVYLLFYRRRDGKN